jgi:hypothetical protein
MLLPDDCNHRGKQPNLTNEDNARATGRPPTPNPEVQTVKPNEGILWIKGVDLHPYLRRFSAPHPKWRRRYTTGLGASGPDRTFPHKLP